MASFTTLFTFLTIALISFSCSSQFISPIEKDPLTNLFSTSLGIGTPQHNFNLAIDLGGPILWYDCNKNYNSSTYTPLSCDSKLCSGDGGCTSCNGPLKPGCTNNTCGATIINALADSLFSGDTGNDVLFISNSKISGLLSSCTDSDGFSDDSPLKGLPKT
ncbi:extracellular dermal glycoprotein, partial [Trifolium medium]|nr:extracellular dermal glycoprotein [Trifolium medium]